MIVTIEQVDVGPQRVEARVRVTDPAYLQTSAAPGLPRRAAELLPGLARHSCENESGRDFLRELADTQTPHLLEHVAAELMALSGSPRSLKADTRWDFARDGRGVFHVSLGYDDDLVAVGSLKEAAVIVEWLLTQGDEQEGARGSLSRPDVISAVERLRAVRSRGVLGG